MQKQNIREYTQLRKEMQHIKKCITDYMGYLLGGTGLVLFGLGFVARSGANPTLAAFTLFALSFVVTFVMLILIYKFISHNRYAGYCMLLNQERWLGDSNRKGDLFAWEWCVERLRRQDVVAEVMDKADAEVREELERKYGAVPELKRWRRARGVFLLGRSLFGLHKTSSWGFPVSITRILVAITGIFLGLGVYYSSVAFDTTSGAFYSKPVSYLIIVTVILQGVLWANTCGRFYNVMASVSTVRAYCRRFLEIRIMLLERYGIKAEYI